MIELCLLWQNDLQQDHQLISSGLSNEYLPYALQHPRICLGLCSLIQENLYAQLGGEGAMQYYLFSMSPIVEWGGHPGNHVFKHTKLN